MAYLFEDSEIEETIAPYIMARIIDAEEFLSEYPWQIQPEDLKLHFRIRDDIDVYKRQLHIHQSDNAQLFCYLSRIILDSLNLLVRQSLRLSLIHI